ncbi:MAG TPA: xanthine dehydrogenase family protein molybdopterin-binding subunit [Acidimicrobiia bacterium]
MTALGDSPLRLEDRPLLTGHGSYVADLVEEETLHCSFVRSPLAHGTFEPPPIEAALDMPGVVAVFRQEEIGLPDLPSSHAPGPPEARGMGQPALARGRVRHVGDPIAVVVAETAAQAADAADQVWVDIDSLPAVTDVQSALHDEVLLFPEAGTNLVLDQTVGSSGPRPAVTRQATVEIEIPRLSPVTIEPLAILVRPDDQDGLEVWCGHQAPWRLPRTLGPLLGIPPGKIRARVPDVGGAFGTKGPFYTEYAVVAAVARGLGRPVVWLQTRREQLLSGTHGRGQTVRVEIGGDEDGRIRFVSSDILGDVGAYPAAGARVPTFSQLVAQGLYDIEHFQVRARVAVTNKAPTGPYRGAGRPEAAIAIERAVDAFAAELGLAPEVVRAKNLIPSTSLPFKTQTGALYDSGDYTTALEIALEALDVGHWRAEQEARRSNGANPIGIGIATFVERAGGAIDSGEWGRVEMRPDGAIEVRTGSTPSGQAHRTVWSQIASSVFSVPMDQVVFIAGDTAKVADGVGSFGSRSAQVGGSAVWRTAMEVKRRSMRAAADLLEASEADLELTDGAFRVVGSPGSEVGFARVVAHASSMGLDLWAEEMFIPGAQTFPYGAHVAVVEVELETGHVNLVSLVVVDDCGTVLNPMVVEGQVHGSVMQGIGEALLEGVIYDDEGQLLTANLVTYLIPSATQAMPLRTHRLVHPAPSNPLGAKGTGETGCIGVPGAILNAVHDALRPIGVRSLDFPLTAPRVWQAIQSARG